METQDHEKENQNDPLKMEPEQRDRVIVRTSLVGVAANVMLAVLKAVIGLAAHSIAITMDAVNNLSDAMSSIITIIGTRLASRAPDRKHPLGHGRAEYLTAAVISQILGERADSSLSKNIKKTVASFDEVNGAYDLLLDNYGPDKIIGSIHIEVPDYLTACQIDALTRRIQDKVYQESGVILATVGVYAYNTQDPQAIAMREHVREIVMRHEHVIQMHGFYVDEEERIMRMDVIVDFTDPDAEAKYKHIQEDIQNEYPQYQVHVTLDYNVSD